MARRDVRWSACLAGAGLWLLAACAPSAPSPPAAAPAPAAPAPAAPAAPAKPEPKYGGVLQYSCTTAPVGLNPYVSAGPAEERTLGSVFDTLTTWKHEVDLDLRNDFIVEPWLAERWEQKDPSTYVLYLRKGVKWHDGADFTADDVVFSLNYAIDPANKLRIRSASFSSVKSVEKVDQYTVRITSQGEVPNFLSAFAERNAFILPKHVNDRGDDFNKVVIGTGPFIFQLKDYDPNKGTLATRNPNYWQAGKPYLDGVRCFYGMQASHEDAAFISGQLDVLHRNDRVQLQTMQRSVPGLQFATISVQNGLSVLPKVDKQPWTDARVRRAIHLAIDRQALKAALFGDGIINPPGMPGDKEGWAIPPEELLTLPGYRQPKDADIAEARRLIAEAGHPGGIKTTLTYGTNLTLGVRIAEPIQAQLAKAGIDITLRPLPVAEARAVEDKGEFELLLQNTADHNMKSQFEHLDANGTAYSAIKDQKLTEMLYRATRSMDMNAARKAGLEMQRYLLETNYIAPTIAPLSFPMWQKWVFNYVYEASNVNRITRSQAYRVWFDVTQMPPDRRS